MLYVLEHLWKCLKDLQETVEDKVTNSNRSYESVRKTSWLVKLHDKEVPIKEAVTTHQDSHPDAEEAEGWSLSPPGQWSVSVPSPDVQTWLQVQQDSSSQPQHRI